MGLTLVLAIGGTTVIAYIVNSHWPASDRRRRTHGLDFPTTAKKATTPDNADGVTH